MYGLCSYPRHRSRISTTDVSGNESISHDLFDIQPRSHAIEFVRSLFVASGLLIPTSPRHRLDRWLARFLQNVPASDRLFLATFAEWRILRRVRNKAERGRLTDAGIKWAQSRIRAAAAFLAWLRERGKSLERASQPDVDLWLADRRVTTRYVVRDFLIWTNARKCSDRLDIPTRSGDEPAMLMDEKQRWREIEKLLVDRTLRNEVRLIALLSLVFAQHVSRVCRLIDALVDDRAYTLYRESRGHQPRVH